MRRDILFRSIQRTRLNNGIQKQEWNRRCLTTKYNLNVIRKPIKSQQFNRPYNKVTTFSKSSSSFSSSSFSSSPSLSSPKSSNLKFYLNGESVVVKHPQPEQTLIEYLRNEKLLTGTKLACGEGGCGACSVTISSTDPKGDVVHRAMNSCLVPLCTVEGSHVTTPEGVGSSKNGIHPTQHALAEHFGSQCGYCTPGFVMSIFSTLLDTKGSATMKQLEKCVDGNLCRCTGYRPIAAALQDLASDGGQKGSLSDRDYQLLDKIVPFIQSHSNTSRHYKGDRCEWYQPTTLGELLDLANQYPDARIVVGNTEVGIERRYGGKEYPVVLCPVNVPELVGYTTDSHGIDVGAALSLTDLWNNLEQTASREEVCGENSHRIQTIRAMTDQLQWFSGTSIRNAACIGGNVVTASPISDLNPVLIALGASMKLVSSDGGERIVPAHQFFKSGYRQVDKRDGEVLVSVHIPYNDKHQYVRAYKQSRRREDDIALVTSGMSISFMNDENEESNGSKSDKVVSSAKLVYGGMASHTIRATHAEEYLQGKKWTREVVEEACKLVDSQLRPPPNSPAGMEYYRSVTAMSMLYRFYLSTSIDTSLSNENHDDDDDDDNAIDGAVGIPHGESLRGVVRYGNEEEEEEDNDNVVVGQPAIHTSAYRQVCGEAVYTDDIPPSTDELYGALVVTDRPIGRIKEVICGEARSMKGVKGVFTHLNVPGSNITGDIEKDEEIFASSRVDMVGQPIALVVADSQREAALAAKYVQVMYEEESENSLMSIEEAMDKGSFFSPIEGRVLERGDVDGALASAPRVVEGEVMIGGQEHFYFEPMVTIARPADGDMHILSSTQNCNKTQMHVASALGLPAHRVTCSVSRIGGGFGGKETHNITPACITAIAAHNLQRPVRLLYSRDDDMKWTGKRHAFKGKYRVGFTEEGDITGCSVDLVSNGGAFTDLSWPVLERALFHSDNAYNIPALRARGRVAKTNGMSNTAFRGFGGPQGMFVTETWMEHVARDLHMDPEYIKRKHLYKPGDTTHYGNTVLQDFEKMWQTTLHSSDYTSRKSQISEFNEQNKWRKRGIAITPAKFGIAFTATFLNQGSALVHVYTDGSVLCTHGGVEMGQGLHTKVQQVCAQALGVPLEHVYINHTGTDKIPNASPTAASVGSDIYGMAALNACKEISNRLHPYRENMGEGASFTDVVKAAYFDRINLSAQGHYSIPVSGYNFDTKEGTPFHYFTSGIAASEVEIDVLTGDHRALRTDVVMDLGKSINPAIDIGQVEGAFVQGQGLTTIEELVWGDNEHPWYPKGHLKTSGPGAYKIPAMDDVPRQFNVTLMKDCENPIAIHSSRAVGEPPLFLGTSVYFATRDAITAARKTHAPTTEPFFPTDSPLTAERIRMACGDQFVQHVLHDDDDVDSKYYRPKGSF